MIAAVDQSEHPRTFATGDAAPVKTAAAMLAAEHAAAALLYFLMGSLGLVAFAPDLAAGNYLAPRVAAATHLFTLGWITTSLMGALYWFLPVAVGQPICSVRLGHVAFVLYAPGLLVFATGLSTGQNALMLVGAVVFAIGLALFIGNLAVTLKRAHRRDVTWWALACATFYLAVTLVLGLALTGNLRWGYMGVGRVGSIGVHLHVALAGWVLLVMVGVGHRLMPMFLLTRGVTDRMAKAAVVLVAMGAGMLAFLHHAPPLISHWLPALSIALGCAAFLLQTRSYYTRRHRRTLDPGMRLAAGALVLLALALVLVLPVLLGGASARISVAYVMTAILAVSLWVAAYYYTIVPLLVWQHRFGSLAESRPLPRLEDLCSTRLATVAGALLVTGAVALVLSVMFGFAPAARTAAVLLAMGATIEVGQMIGLLRTAH